MAKSKVNLDILKRLVSELETTLTAAESINAEHTELKDFIVEMSKASGLAAGVMAEAGALVGDIQNEVWTSQSPKSKSTDTLSSLLASLKGGGLTGKN